MKRSEMIAKLKFWIDDNTWANDDRGVSDYARDHTDEELEELANMLMDKIEEAGMLPPQNLKQTEEFYGEGGHTDNQCPECGWWTSYEWEPEDA